MKQILSFSIIFSFLLTLVLAAPSSTQSPDPKDPVTAATKDSQNENLTAKEFKKRVDKLFERLPGKVDRSTSGSTFVWNIEFGTPDNVLNYVQTAMNNPEDLKIISAADTNKLIISIKNNNFQLFQETIELLEMIDMPVKQVLIEVMIAEFVLGDTETWESQWRMYANKAFDNSNLVSSLDLQHSPLNEAEESQSEGLNYFIINNQNMSAFINAQHQNQKFNVLSSPHIVASNHKKAMFHRGRSVPYLKGVSHNESGVLTSNYGNYKVGIDLGVTPHITDQGQIYMEIDQRIDEIVSNDIERGTVVTDNNEINTCLTVPEGKTVVMSGFIRNSERELIKKIPILSDIPLIGKFFNRSRKSHEKTELIVFITPRIIDERHTFSQLTEHQKNRLARTEDGQRMISEYKEMKEQKSRKKRTSKQH